MSAASDVSAPAPASPPPPQPHSSEKTGSVFASPSRSIHGEMGSDQVQRTADTARAYLNKIGEQNQDLCSADLRRITEDVPAVVMTEAGAALFAQGRALHSTSFKWTWGTRTVFAASVLLAIYLQFGERKIPVLSKNPRLAQALLVLGGAGLWGYGEHVKGKKAWEASGRAFDDALHNTNTRWVEIVDHAEPGFFEAAAQKAKSLLGLESGRVEKPGAKRLEEVLKPALDEQISRKDKRLTARQIGGWLWDDVDAVFGDPKPVDAGESDASGADSSNDSEPIGDDE